MVIAYRTLTKSDNNIQPEPDYSTILNSPEYIAAKNRSKQFHKDLARLRQNYIAHRDFLSILDDYSDLQQYIKILPTQLLKEFDLFQTQINNLETDVLSWNKEFVIKEITECSKLYENIDGIKLDNDQWKSIVIDDDNELIIAGAGSGKTLTLSGKVQYLINRKKINPEEILLISFTNKATDELGRRVKSGTGVDIKAKTFHKLGLDIITDYTETRPNITSDESSNGGLQGFIRNYFENDLLSDPNQITRLLTFFGGYIHIPPQMEMFESIEDVTGYYKGLDFQTLRSLAKKYIDEIGTANKETYANETVKSLEELTIANFLYINGIDYEYEKLYPKPYPERETRPYHPDFYLPEYDIYLEHFGINEYGRLPWLTSAEEKKYIAGIKWKRELHKQNGTKLIETYSYYNKNGHLTDKLSETLKENGVTFKQRDLKDIYVRWMQKQYTSGYYDFITLIATFITLYKSNGNLQPPIEAFENYTSTRCNLFYKERTRLFLEIITPVFEKYQQNLKETNSIDFCDMINHATELLKTRTKQYHYKYIIIDEFQDIAVGRFYLIKALRDITGAKIVCVGDDWQSIYQFSGSDIGIFTRFEKYFGYSIETKIKNTYRNSQELIDAAGSFIMKNTQQIEKSLQSRKHKENPIKIYYYTNNNGITSPLNQIIEDIVQEFGDDTRILVIGRTHYAIQEDRGRCIFGDGYKYKFSKAGSFIKSEKYPRLTIQFMTAHSAKGLEADNVILLGLDNNPLGFPCKIVDDPLLDLVLISHDNYLYAEERRVFYVALTRTRNNVYLPVPASKTKRSPFIKEVELYLKDSKNKQTVNTGKIEFTRDNEQSNNRKNYKNDTEIKCPKCGAPMVIRNGPYGLFLGCSRYPECRGTRSINNKR